jgi:hypothetical protein
LYKRRGRAGALRHGLPPDFGEHVEFFRKELAILQPTRIVALGDLAYQLLSRYVPEVRLLLKKIWHFAYVARYNKQAAYVIQMREAFNARSSWLPGSPLSAISKATSRTVDNRHGSDNLKLREVCMAVHSAPPGVRTRRWTLRDDNRCHHHGIVSLSESPLYLELSWRPTAANAAQRVGTFLLDLDALLRAGCILAQSSDKRADVRLRITRAEDGNFYIQATATGPRIQLVGDPSLQRVQGNETVL